MSNNILKSGIWYTFSNFIVRGIGFITTPLFTRLLTQEEFGNYSNIATWIAVIMIITSLNLDASLTRAKYDFDGDNDNYMFSMMSLSFLSTSIWFVISLLLRSYFVDLLKIDSLYINCMFVYLLFYPAISLFINNECIFFRYKTSSLIGVLVAISSSVLSVLLVCLLPNRLLGRVLGYVLPVGAIGAIILFGYYKKKLTIKISYWKYALPFTLPFIPHLLSMNLLSSMDRLMIINFCGASDVALYSLAYTCGSIISILVTSLNNAFSPWLAEKLNKKDYKSINTVSIPYVLGFAYMAGGMTLIIPELLLILGGKQYISAMNVMPPVIASTILQFVYCMYVNVEQFEKKTKLMACASVVACLSNFILNYYFIPLWGYIAAAYTTYASYFLLMTLHMVIVNAMGMSKVYKNISIIMITLITSAIMFCSTFIMNNYVIRYCLLLTYILLGILIVYFNRIRIMQFIKKE